MNSNRKMIRQLDGMITELMAKMQKPKILPEDLLDYQEQMEKLVDQRVKLHDSQVKASLMPTLIKSIFGVGTVLIVLHYEKLDIITSKAFNMSTRMIES